MAEVICSFISKGCENHGQECWRCTFNGALKIGNYLVLKDKDGKTKQKSIRKPGKIKDLNSKLSLGPYWMKYRQEWLKQLLEIEKSLKDNGHEFKLISIDELQAIRQQWLRDPNEPDWADSLPRIYSNVYDTCWHC